MTLQPLKLVQNFHHNKVAQWMASGYYMHDGTVCERTAHLHVDTSE